MIHELKPAQSGCARSLFEPLAFHASCAAVLAGVNPGRIFVDDPAAPTCGLVLSPEAVYLAGDADAAGFCNALRACLNGEDPLRDDLFHIEWIVPPGAWERRLADLTCGDRMARTARRHYLLNCAEARPAIAAPSGAVSRPIDVDLLQDEAIELPEHTKRWMNHNWGSRERFLEAGFGVVTVCEEQVVSWSVADCVADDTCEIGIRTAPAWRGKGMGAFTAASAVALATVKGMRHVGWHCPEDNVASQRTAEKVGFRLERKYEALNVA